MKLFKPRKIWLPTWQGWLLLLLIFSGLFFIFFMNAHRFLAVTSRVADADILVVEDWVANKEVFLRATVKEFKEGHYRYLFISGTREYNEKNNELHNSGQSPVFHRLVASGIPKDQIREFLTPATESHRSATMARGVRNALRQENIRPRGINVIAPATHARKTWLVHRRALPETPVGIVAIVPDVYDPERWWLNSESAKWVLINYAGLLYEWITGL